MGSEKELHMALLPAFVLLAFCVGCQTTPYTERTQLMLTSTQEEIQMGEQEWASICKKSKVSTNASYNAAVKRVGMNIAQVAEQPNYRWEFKVFENKEPNAFCLPGGKIGVFSGLFQFVANDAELAAVVGHEIGHAVARHGGERMSQSTLQQIGSEVTKVFGALVQGRTGVPAEGWLLAYTGLTNVGAMLPFSRAQEYEADKLGMILMAKAGYSPSAALAFWGKFKNLSQGSTLGNFLSTHPVGEKRIQEMESFLPQAVALYSQASTKWNLGERYH